MFVVFYTVNPYFIFCLVPHPAVFMTKCIYM